MSEKEKDIQKQENPENATNTSELNVTNNQEARAAFERNKAQFEKERLELDEAEQNESEQSESTSDSNESPIEKAEKVKNFAQNAQRNIQNLAAAVSRTAEILVSLLFNPVTWIAMGFAFVLIVMLAGMQVAGQSDYNIECLPSGMGSVNISEDADDFTRQSAIASWLTSTPFAMNGDAPFTKEQAAGILGNFIVESSGADPTVVQTISLTDPDYYLTCNNDCVLSWGSVGGKAIGIAQWDGGRRIALVNFAKNAGKPWYDLNVQLQFLKQELDSTEGASLAAGGFNELTHTVEEYTVLWNRIFERSAGDDNSPHVLRRQEAAVGFFNDYKGGGAFTANCLGTSIDTSNIVQLAIQVSWPFGEPIARQNCTTHLNCGMDFSKPEYIAAKELAESKTSPDPMPGLLASCDRFVATILRATGADPNFPWGAVTHQEIYMESQPQWARVSCQDRIPGDVIVAKDQHIMMYVGIVDGRESLASASALERTASIMSVSCNGDYYQADGYSNAQGWRLIKAN